MAGRAGERTLAGAFEIDVVAMRDLQHRQSAGRVDLDARAISLDERHLGHCSVFPPPCEGPPSLPQPSATRQPADAALRSRRTALPTRSPAKATSASDVKRPSPMRIEPLASASGTPSAFNT